MHWVFHQAWIQLVSWYAQIQVFCDTTIIIFHVVQHKPPKEIKIDVKEGSTLKYCIDPNEVCMPILSVQSFCPDKVFDNSKIVLSPNAPNSLCFDVTGVKAGGQDTLCLNICCDLGNCDTVYVIVNVLPIPHKQVVDVTVEEATLLNIALIKTQFALQLFL
jgi:hypothetical protein